jgi:hypothetical protein
VKSSTRRRSERQKEVSEENDSQQPAQSTHRTMLRGCTHSRASAKRENFLCSGGEGRKTLLTELSLCFMHTSKRRCHNNSTLEEKGDSKNSLSQSLDIICSLLVFHLQKKREKRERKAFFIIISDFIFGFNAKESEVRRATHLITSLLVLVREVKTKNSSRPHPVILCDNQDRKQSPYCLIVR